MPVLRGDGMTAAEFAGLLPRPPQRRGEWWDGLCPGHDDHSASLSFTDGDRRLILKCRAGCPDDRIVKALNLDLGALFHNNGHPASSEILATYDYVSERGELLYQVVGYPPKTFKQRRPDGHGGWIWSVRDVRRVVYRLQELAEAQCVVHVEGEKDADRLVELGWRATTTAGAAETWRDKYADQVKAAGARDVVIIPDNDAPGERYAAMAARSYLQRELRVKVVRLPDLIDKGDVSDWLDTGHTLAELAAVIDATPWIETPPGLTDRTAEAGAAAPVPLGIGLGQFLTRRSCTSTGCSRRRAADGLPARRSSARRSTRSRKRSAWPWD
jgi:putative DNA primase/helicase